MSQAMQLLVDREETNSKFRASERLISSDEHFSFEKRTQQNINLGHDVQRYDEYLQIDH